MTFAAFVKLEHGDKHKAVQRILDGYLDRQEAKEEARFMISRGSVLFDAAGYEFNGRTVAAALRVLDQQPDCWKGRGE